MFFQHAIGVLLLSMSAYGMISFGACPNKTAVQNFDINKFSGFWYENRALEGIHLTQEGWGNCVSVFFNGSSRTTLTSDQIEGNILFPNEDDDESYDRQNATISTVVLGTNHTGVIKTDFIKDAGKVGIFRIRGQWRFLSMPVPSITVLDGDFNEWALLWSCQDMGSLMNKQTAWVITRTKTISSITSSAIIASLFSHNLPETEFRVTEQTNCKARRRRRPFFFSTSGNVQSSGTTRGQNSKNINKEELFESSNVDDGLFAYQD